MDAAGGKSASPADGSLLGDVSADHALIAVSSLFEHVLTVVDAVARNSSVVLLEGESGTGKELLARRIHQRSHRAGGPFIPVNCPGISDTLFESQFYGHVKGAFTGAATDTMGVVRAAAGGTLLLDEVGELALHLQPKLLRLLQEREVTPVGESRPIPVDARFIAATNKSLVQAVAERKFRSDLYHRLNIVRIEVPPLRSRTEDVEPLLDYYLDYYAKLYNMPKRELGPRLRNSLVKYPWTGNVRELCAYIERLYAADLPAMPPTLMSFEETLYPGTPPIEPDPDRMPPVDMTPVCCSLAEAEAVIIRRALEAAGYNRTAAARMLDIHRSTLLRKIRTYGLDERL
jgi:transcriptional regulator with PAS, ATPase and Fis domain